MKKSNIIGVVIFIVAIPFTFLSYIFYDWIKGVHKKEKKEPVSPTFHTLYPEKPIDDFNEWTNHIYKLTNRKN